MTLISQFCWSYDFEYVLIYLYVRRMSLYVGNIHKGIRIDRGVMLIVCFQMVQGKDCCNIFATFL